jgi:hypothetical protein
MNFLPNNYIPMNKSWIIAPLAALALATSACHSHDEQTVTVSILSPADNSTVANAASIPLQVQFTASDELHDAEVRIKNEANDSTVYLWEGSHLHVASYTLTDTLNLSALPAGTQLHVEATGYYDHDATSGATAEIHFSIQ